jgi:hypothetical protein
MFNDDEKRQLDLLDTRVQNVSHRRGTVADWLDHVRDIQQCRRSGWILRHPNTRRQERPQPSTSTRKAIRTSFWTEWRRLRDWDQSAVRAVRHLVPNEQPPRDGFRSLVVRYPNFHSRLAASR